MQAGLAIRVVAAAILILAVSVSASRAEVRIEVSTGVPDEQGKVAVDVSVYGRGFVVGGFQNDIVFDNTAVRLDDPADCRINPAIGVLPLGNEPGVPTCHDDPTMGACKTLVRNVTTCAEEAAPHGCLTEDPRYSRLRVIVAAIEVANVNSIPDGVAYTCVFTVADPAQLPVGLFNTNTVASDPFGKRLPSVAEHGDVCVDQEGLRSCAAPRELSEPCAIDFECASGHCDVCCDHQFNGICAAPRTPTPTASPSPTRNFNTRSATGTRAPTLTRTPTLSPTVTNTPTPKSIGDPCARVDECATDLSCNLADGVCCIASDCPQGMSCNVPGFAGYCVRRPLATPTPELEGVIIEIGSATPGADGFAEVPVTLRGQGFDVGGMQNDIIFDIRNATLARSQDCVINPAIGLMGEACMDDLNVGPCKNLNRNLSNCGETPLPPGCPAADPNLSRFRGIIAATAVPNANPIPDTILYTCRFKVLDTARLPIELRNFNVVVSDPIGNRIESTAVSGRIEPSFVPPTADGDPCTSDDECMSGFCVDGSCCTVASCAADESCSISGFEGVCTPPRPEGEGCNFGDDCETGNCDLLLSPPTLGVRGICGTAREPSPVPECDDFACSHHQCVDGFCCDDDVCPFGQFCNTGSCAPPAEPGAPCNADEQCALGLCVDGACCVTGSCPEGESCGVPTREGVCREPFRLGSECSLDEQCPTGFCTSGVCCLSDDCPAGSVCSRSTAPGHCVDIGSEPDKPEGSDGKPTAPAPGGVATVSATRTLPQTPLPTSSVPGTASPTIASQPTVTATAVAVRNKYRLTPGDSCSMTSSEPSGGSLWLSVFAVLLTIAKRRTRR